MFVPFFFGDNEVALGVVIGNAVVGRIKLHVLN